MATINVTNDQKIKIQPILSASSGINSAETVIGGASNAIPPNFLKAGQNIKVTILGTCTSSATNASTFALRVGPLGTVSDAVAATCTACTAAASGTAVPFKVTYDLTVRTVGAAATLYGSCTVLNTGVTGLSDAAVKVTAFTASAFDSTATNFWMPTYVAAASTTTCTFQNVIFEII